MTGLLLHSGAFPRMSEDWKAARGMRRAVRGEKVMQLFSYAVAA